MKLKKLLNENVWNNRKFGEPLPTLEDTSKAYKLKKEQEVKEPVLTENNLKVRKEALYKINYMLRYSQRLGSDEKSDLKELAKIVSKIK